LELSYNQLETALSAHLGVHPDRIGTFRSRIKQLQRLQFPSGVNVGRGTRMRYSAEHLFQLVSAFELMDLGLPAATAIAIVNAEWPNFLAAYGLAIRNEFYEHRGSTPYFPPIYLRISHKSLAPLQQVDPEEGPRFVAEVETMSRMLEALEESVEREANSFLLICASHVMRSVLYSARDAQAEDPFTDPEFDGWYARGSEYAWWMFGDGRASMNLPAGDDE